MSKDASNWVLITGANRGLGSKLCRKFLETNRNVLAVSRQGRCAQFIADHISVGNGVIRDQRCDLGQRADIEALITDVSGLQLGGIICNAAIYSDKPFAGTSVNEICELCEINAWSHLRIIKGLEGALVPGASIVIINSIGINMAADKEFAYILSKKILSGIADGLQFHFGKRGISVVNVLLGGIRTDMAKGRQGAENFIDPDEAAAAVVSMCSLGDSVRCRTVELLRRKY